MERPTILTDRATYSRVRLEELRNRLAGILATSGLADLSVFCAGSYARLEASEHSDIDLFFVYGTEEVVRKHKRTDELMMFASIIEIAKAMNFPAFSNDGEYLKTFHCSDVLIHLGSRDDDGLNLFTLRMLMLLESHCLLGDETFANVQGEVVRAYYRDYPDHQDTFQPRFLINDIGRFWKTLLLNYEHKRNQPTEDEIVKNKQKVKNFKLKYSRMTTCFATIAALATMKNPSEDDVLALVNQTPMDRLIQAAEKLPSIESRVESVLESYAWFIEQTGQPEADLLAGFVDKEGRHERFRRANEYGDLMFDLLRSISEHADQPRLLRFLVI